MYLDLPRLIAHRGAKAYAPENTLASITEADNRGAKWVELDVMLTACGEPIIFHDETVSRTTDGRGKVSELTLDNIKSFDNGRWFKRRYKGEKVPTLEEVIDLLAEKQMMMNLEIKPTAHRAYETTSKVLAVLMEKWPIDKPFPLLSSFDLDCLGLAQTIAPEIPRGLLLDKWTDDCPKLIDKYASSSVHLYYRIITPERVQTIKEKGNKVLAYTVNSKRKAIKLFRMGVDSIFSDYPDLLAKVNFDKLCD